MKKLISGFFSPGSCLPRFLNLCFRNNWSALSKSKIIIAMLLFAVHQQIQSLFWSFEKLNFAALMEMNPKFKRILCFCRPLFHSECLGVKIQGSEDPQIGAALSNFVSPLYWTGDAFCVTEPLTLEGWERPKMNSKVQRNTKISWDLGLRK